MQTRRVLCEGHLGLEPTSGSGKKCLACWHVAAYNCSLFSATRFRIKIVAVVIVNVTMQCTESR